MIMSIYIHEVILGCVSYIKPKMEMFLITFGMASGLCPWSFNSSTQVHTEVRMLPEANKNMTMEINQSR